VKTSNVQRRDAEPSANALASIVNSYWSVSSAVLFGVYRSIS
jgi:hypothetical protein